jgi:hypothetical protein
MKRLFAVALVCAASFLVGSKLHAQNLGAIAGATFSNLKNVNTESSTGFNVGATALFKLPLGFSVQTSLIYNAKSAGLGKQLLSGSLDVSYLELPVSLQWGPDILVFRPCLDVTPFVGYALAGNLSVENILTDTTHDWDLSKIQRLAYGIGVGGGLEVWRFQLLCRYNWNFGQLFESQDKIEMPDVQESFKNRNFGGVTLTLAYFFGK